MSYIQPTMPDAGYSFVAAGALQRNYGGLSIYIKYRPGPKYKITTKQVGANHLWLVCPDRELVIVRNNQNVEAFYPYGDSFDECLDFNIYNDSVCKGLGIEYIMTNFVHDGKSISKRRESSRLPSERIQVLSDSGGLQLARGVKSTISPDTLIEFYNNNADAGMILDLPLFFSDPKITKKAALLQKRNSDYMLSKSKGVELLNIFHGQTDEERSVFRAIVEDKRIPRVAIGGLSFFYPVGCVNAVYDTIYGSDLRYKQYHVLGIYTMGIIPLLVKLSNASSVHITSDSTSNIQSSINKAYHYQFDIYHKMSRIPIGSRGAQKNALRFLPCQCKICTSIKYMDILGFGDMRFTSELLALHNAAEMSRYADSLQEVCLHSTPKEYNELVRKQLEKTPELQHTMWGLDFIDRATELSLKSAKKHYKHSLKSRRFETQDVTKPLIGDYDLTENEFKTNVVQQMKLMEQTLKGLE